MNKEAALMKKAGGNMLKSIGIGREPSREAAASGHRSVIPINDAHEGRTRNHEAGFMDIENIVPDPDQVRKEFPEEPLRRLAESIKRYGVLNAIEVRWNDELSKHVICHGERRYRAAKEIGLEQVPCIFKDGQLSEPDKKKRQLTENCLREDLTPKEQAIAFRQLMQLEGWNAQELAEALCVSKALVTTRLSIFDLPEDLQDQVGANGLSGDHAYEVSKLESPEAQRKFVEEIQTQKLNRDETRKRAKEITGKTTKAKPGRPVTTKTFKVDKAQVTVKFNKKTVNKSDIEAALEEALKQVRAA